MKNAWSKDPTGVRPAATTAFIVDLLVRIGKKPQRQHSTVLALHYGTRSITAPLLPNTHARRSGPSGAGEDGAPIALRSSTLICAYPADTRTGSPLNAYSAS